MKHNTIRLTSEQESRFWSKVSRPNETECWEWFGALRTDGYGKFYAGAHLSAHRVSYMLLMGQIPSGMVLDHLCRNPLCVNPLHLEPVSQRENVKRGLLKDLHPFREICRAGHDKTLENATDSRGTCRICHAEQSRKTRSKQQAYSSATLTHATNR